MDVCRLLLTLSLLSVFLCVLSYSDHNQPLTNNIFPERHRIPSSDIFPHQRKTVTSDPVHFFHMRERPRKRNLKIKKLLKKLGNNFKPFWMSIEEPVSISTDIVTLSGTNRDNVDVKLVADFDQLNLTFVNYDGVAVAVSDENIQLFKRWLIVRGTCQVMYKWEDQGELFWPRWVKKGTCSNDFSCSWPMGMHCVPKESKIIQLLRWNCSSRKRSRHFRRKYINQIRRGVSRKRKSRRKCRWIKVMFPVTDECFCSC